MVHEVPVMDEDDSDYDATREYAVGDVLTTGRSSEAYSVVKVTPKTLWLMPCAPTGRRVQMISGAGVFVYRVVHPVDGAEEIMVRKRLGGFRIEGRRLRPAPVVHGDHVVRVISAAATAL